VTDHPAKPSVHPEKPSRWVCDTHREIRRRMRTYDRMRVIFGPRPATWAWYTSPAMNVALTVSPANGPVRTLASVLAKCSHSDAPSPVAVPRGVDIDRHLVFVVLPVAGPKRVLHPAADLHGRSPTLPPVCESGGHFPSCRSRPALRPPAPTAPAAGGTPPAGASRESTLWLRGCPGGAGRDTGRGFHRECRVSSSRAAAFVAGPYTVGAPIELPHGRTRPGR
jgi:hypothetical protein